jgi:hypothetical protein
MDPKKRNQKRNEKKYSPESPPLLDNQTELLETLSISVPETIQRGNKFYLIEQSRDESREAYLVRVQYIITKLTESPSLLFDEVIKLSFIRRNIKLNGMTYPRTIIKQL